MRLIDADELYRKVSGYKGVVDKSVAKRLIEQMPPADAVSRQAAIDLVTDMEFMNNTAKGILRDRLRKLPSAPPERENEMSYVCKRGYKCMCFQCKEKDCEHFESEPSKWVKNFFEYRKFPFTLYIISYAMYW